MKSCFQFRLKMDCIDLTKENDSTKDNQSVTLSLSSVGPDKDESVPLRASITQADKTGHARVWWKIVIGKYNGITSCAICAMFSKIGKKWVFQEEKSADGYEHWQCLLAVRKKCRKLYLLKTIAARLKTPMLNVSLDPSDEEFKEYCSKLDTRVDGPWSHGFPEIPSEPLDILKYEDLYVWQKQVWDMCNEEPDNRKIYWYFDPEGCAGKTQLCKSLVYYHNAFIFGGKSRDIASRVCQMPGSPKLCVMNVSRTHEKFVSYEALEQLKDGMLQSGKYEGGQKIFNSPHVLVMANFEPEWSAMTKDRWAVYKLQKVGDAYESVPFACAGHAPHFFPVFVQANEESAMLL